MTKLEFLQTLIMSYPSDIESHGYLEPLSKHLPDKCRSMLEIGIANGYSAEIWNAFYGSQILDLHYLDLFENPDFVSARYCRNKGYVPHIGDQSSLKVLSEIKDQFDCILDDGSHVAVHQLASFKHLFINNLKSGGVYIITDCHCNLEEFYWGDGVNSIEDTPIGLFKKYLITYKIQNFMFSQGEANVFQNLIKGVFIEANEKMIVIYKR